MLKFLAFLFSRNIYWAWSALIATVLRIKGAQIGKNFYIEGTPYLKIRGNFSNIIIGDNVKIFGPIDLRNRENGKIIIGNDVSIDNDCRLVAANDAALTIQNNCKLGPYSIINAGANVTIGAYSLCAGFIYIQSSNHGMEKNEKIQLQGHVHGDISIGEDVWLGGNVTILKGVKIGNGAVIGAKSVVTKDIASYDIVAGVPAKVIGKRG